MISCLIINDMMSETDLLNDSRECIFCDKIGFHNYNMLVDHLHTHSKHIKREMVSVKLDADCDFCKSVGRPSCCMCINMKKNNEYQVMNGYYISICNDCTLLYENRMVEKTTYTYCVICNVEHDCPSCYASNNEDFTKLKYCEYQDKYIKCGNCCYTYRPKDSILF